MAIIKRIGFGQVEPNHLSAQRNGQVYAQLPCKKEIKVLENGQFVKYDYATNGGEINFTGDGEWMLVMNEVKTYHPYETAKDFALVKANALNGKMAPRVLKTMPGDIFTTYCLEKAGDYRKETVGTETIEVGTDLKINANGFLSTEGTGDMVFQVVKVYTMPDGQAAVKVMRIK